MGITPSPPSPPAPPAPPTHLVLSNVLGNGMVLQRAPARSRIWGVSTPGDVVTVTVTTIQGDRVSVSNATASEDDGQWSVRLSPLQSNGPYAVIVQSKRQPDDVIALTDVLAGEVRCAFLWHIVFLYIRECQ